MSKNNYLQGKFSGSLNLMSVSLLLALTACASTEPKTEMVEVEEYYRGGTLVSRQVVNHNTKQEHEIQPIKTPSAVKNPKLVPENEYQARRAVSVIPNQGNSYIARPTTTTFSEHSSHGKVQNVVSRYGENHVVNISQDFPNIILTPFKTARAMGLENRDYDMGNNGKAIIIKPRLAKKLWISITDEDNPQGVPISLTLVPKKGINSQTIIASVANGVANLASPIGYQQSLSDVMKAVANKQLPTGYVIRPLNHKFKMANNISVKPVEQYSGNQFDVYRYRLHNKTGAQQVLAEEMFANDSRVVAVSFYPKTVLNHGDETDVLIMVQKGR